MPVDNRVALSPEQVTLLIKNYPRHDNVVQSGDICAFPTGSRLLTMMITVISFLYKRGRAL